VAESGRCKESRPIDSSSSVTGLFPVLAAMVGEVLLTCDFQPPSYPFPDLAGALKLTSASEVI
jgi:hypothetical protein